MTMLAEPEALTFTEPPIGLRWMVRDWLTEAGRHLRAMPRNLDIVIFSLMQPIMFLLLFKYVFGGSIRVDGYDNYDQYLMPGIFAQTVVFGSAFTGVGIAEDMQRGFIDRLRSLPISQSSVLVGRTMSDLLRNCVTFLVMLIVAFAAGFRFEGGLVRGLAATGLLLFFTYAFSWISAFLGLMVKSVEAANSAGFIWMFPVTFVSSAFVVTSSMTPWLARVADANPFTVVTNAARALYNGRDSGNDLVLSLGWAIGIILVFSVLAARRFGTATSR